MSTSTPRPDMDLLRTAESDRLYFVGSVYQPEDAAVHARIMAWLRQASQEEVFQSAVEAGIYSPDGRLLPPYAEESEPAPASTDTTVGR
jgi:hypothetical protein